MARPKRSTIVLSKMVPGQWITAGRLADRTGLSVWEVKGDLVKLRSMGVVYYRRHENAVSRTHSAGEWISSHPSPSSSSCAEAELPIAPKVSAI